jgi:hypothetical protein
MHWHHIEMQVDRIIATNAGQSVAVRNWRPSAPATNSIHVLAVHTIANVRQAVIEAIFSQPTGRDRDAEFTTVADGSNNQADSWPLAKMELVSFLERLTDDEMAELRLHPRRGERPVREILIMASTHAAEHAGHCELTRDLAVAAGV